MKPRNCANLPRALVALTLATMWNATLRATVAVGLGGPSVAHASEEAFTQQESARPPSLDSAVPELLYRATGGSSWRRSDNRLADHPVDEWHGVEAEDTGEVVGLDLWGAMCLSDSAPAPSSLEPREYALWEGDWFNAESALEDNVYELLSITDADAAGFTYSFECRPVPYGPNAYEADEARASFRGPFEAEDRANVQTFVLLVDPHDRHDRVIETAPRAYPVGGPCFYSDEFVFQRSTYKAGFDCEQASTPVELTICSNELIALGDWEMAVAYRELRKEFSADASRLRSSQRAWLNDRNRSCLSGDEVDDICLARLYSDRLATLAKLRNPSMGVAPRFDAAYVLPQVIAGGDLQHDTPARLAVYPQRLAAVAESQWRADESGLLFEQTYVDTKVVWPRDVEFRYSQMLFVGSDGAVWTARHIEPLLAIEYLEELNPYQLWAEAGGEPFTIRSAAGVESTEPPALGEDVPELVRSWLDRHPISETMRDLPNG